MYYFPLKHINLTTLLFYINIKKINYIDKTEHFWRQNAQYINIIYNIEFSRYK